MNGSIIGGQIDSVVAEIKKVISLSEDVGLKLNSIKCEILRIKPLSDAEIEKLNEIIPGIIVSLPEDFCLLGAPLTLDGIPEAIRNKSINCTSYFETNKFERTSSIVHCLSIPKIMRLLRSSPCWLFKGNLNKFDKVVQHSVKEITNVNFDENARTQCSLPIQKGLLLTTDI